MLNINFQTPNIVVAHYFRGGGGKFILNCLGLSRHVVLQDEELAEQQLSGNLSPGDKHKLLLDRITDTVNKWEDLGLGCKRLFGVFDFNTDNLQLKPVISTLSNSDFKFCVVAHDYEDLHWVLKTWPNAIIIQFQNERSFIKECRPDSEWDIPEYLDIFWQNIRGAEWPNHAPTNLALYKQLPKFIQDEIAEVHGNEILKHYAELDSCQAIDRKLMDTHPYYTWNCDWFLDEATTIGQIQELYKQLNLDDFNLDLVTEFYRAWICKLNFLNSIPL